MPTGTPEITVTFVPPAKPWWRSRTLSVNALALALAAAESQLQMLQPLLPVNVWMLLAFALPVVNAYLRAITTTAVQLVPPRPGPHAAPNTAQEP
jgi:hypothetical protein